MLLQECGPTDTVVGDFAFVTDGVEFSHSMAYSDKDFVSTVSARTFNRGPASLAATVTQDPHMTPQPHICRSRIWIGFGRIPAVCAAVAPGHVARRRLSPGRAVGGKSRISKLSRSMEVRFEDAQGASSFDSRVVLQYKSLSLHLDSPGSMCEWRVYVCVSVCVCVYNARSQGSR